MDFSSKRVIVMGLGRFGGGVGVTRYLVHQGADVLVTDLASADELHDSLAQLKDLPFETRLGEHNVSDFTTADLIVANPAVKPNNRFLRAACAAGVPITREIRLLIERLPNRLRTIGITGSAGKSTVAAMIHHVLQKSTEKIWIGGNIGGSLLDHIEEIQSNDWVILELSSFMLEALREDLWSPHIAIVTNIIPNHLDWHETMEHYVAAKQVILNHQSADDFAFLGHSTRDWKTRGRVYEVNDQPGGFDLKIPGAHNEVNANYASSVCIDIAPEINVSKALTDFTGLPHRLQFIVERNGVRCYNDSKSTTPEAARLAIAAFDPNTVHIILGGYDKGSDLTELAHFAEQHCAGIYTIGQTGPRLHELAPISICCNDLDVAVTAALDAASPGQIILLSPGCASWDQFTHYEQRGNRFVSRLRTELS